MSLVAFLVYYFLLIQVFAKNLLKTLVVPEKDEAAGDTAAYCVHHHVLSVAIVVVVGARVVVTVGVTSFNAVNN